MGCNNTYSSFDSKISKVYKTPLGHPVSGHNRPENRPALVKAIQSLSPEYQKKSLEQIRDQLVKEKTSSAHKKWFQQVGEMYATRGHIAPELGVGLVQLPYGREASFRQGTHGFDHLGMTKDGKLAVFETKCYSKQPTKEGLDQLSTSHVKSRLERMQKEGGKQAQGANPEIASLASYTGIVRYLVHVSYDEKNYKVYEISDDDKGNPVMGDPIMEGHAKDYMGNLYSLYFAD